VTGLPGEENRGLTEDLALLAQLPILPAQAAQLLTLDAGEAIATATCVQIGLANPLPNRGLGQVQLPGDLADRLAGVRISSTTSALYSGGKNRRGRGIGLPSRGQSPHPGCPPSRVNSTARQGASRPLRSAVPSQLQQLGLGHYKSQPPACYSAIAGPLAPAAGGLSHANPDQHLIVSVHQLVDLGELENIN
jgi:hypothetical protein